MPTLTEILATVPATATLVDSNNQGTLACDLDASEDEREYIRDGDEIIAMRPDGFRDYVAYWITE